MDDSTMKQQQQQQQLEQQPTENHRAARSCNSVLELESLRLNEIRLSDEAKPGLIDRVVLPALHRIRRSFGLFDGASSGDEAEEEERTGQKRRRSDEAMVIDQEEEVGDWGHFVGGHDHESSDRGYLQSFAKLPRLTLGQLEIAEYAAPFWTFVMIWSGGYSKVGTSVSASIFAAHVVQCMVTDFGAVGTSYLSRQFPSLPSISLKRHAQVDAFTMAGWAGAILAFPADFGVTPRTTAAFMVGFALLHQLLSYNSRNYSKSPIRTTSPPPRKKQQKKWDTGDDGDYSEEEAAAAAKASSSSSPPSCSLTSPQ